MPKLIDRTGHVYGRLSVVSRFECGPASKGARTKWNCRCECGQDCVATGHELASGDTTSCGCFLAEMRGDLSRTHGLSGTPTYRSWQAAKERCYNPNNVKYPTYGAIGITMCAEWKNSFEAFLRDMGKRPIGTTMDRLDQCKGYEPGNCRWATPKEQTRTRGTTRLHRWRATWMTLSEVAEAEGIPFNSLRKVIKAHNTIQGAVAYVVEHRKSHPPS